RVLAQLRATQAGVAHYADLATRRIGIQIAFGLMFTIIALIVLLSAVWIGLNFANYLVAPIRRLIGAAQMVATGNLFVQVPTRGSEGDLAQLGQTFNKMTQELRTQRAAIARARALIDSRRGSPEAAGGENRSRSPRQGAGRDVPRACRAVHDGTLGVAAAGARTGHTQPQRPRAQPVGPRDKRAAVRLGRARLRSHPRRYHRARHRPAHFGMGRCRAADRA